MNQLTVAKVKSLKSKEKVYTVSDGGGLFLRIQPTGRMVWYYQYAIGKKRVRMNIGSYPGYSLAEARDARNGLARKVVRGVDPKAELQEAARQQEVEEEREGLTLATFAERYYVGVVVPSRKAHEEVKAIIDKAIVPVLGHRLLTEVTAKEIREQLIEPKQRTHTYAALRLRNILKGIYDYAFDLGLVEGNPAMMLKSKYICKQEFRTRVLYEPELATVLKRVYASHISEKLKIMTSLLLITMVRKKELVCAPWTEIHLGLKEWHIPASRPKNGKPHIVYLSDQAIELFHQLTVYGMGSEWVCVTQGNATSHK